MVMLFMYILEKQEHRYGVVIIINPNTMESKRDSMGHLGTHLVSVSLNMAKMDSIWVAIFCSG